MAACAVMVVLLILIVKKERSEYAAVIEIAGVTALLLGLMSYVPTIVDAARELVSLAGVRDEYLKLLLKALGTAIVAEITAAVCRDNGSAALAANVEIAAKMMILVMCLPMIGVVVELAAKLITQN